MSHSAPQHSQHDSHGDGGAHAAAHAHDAGTHHGHVIVSQRILLGVLGILLFFTLATVGAAQAEQWISYTFNIIIPQWVNVAVALLIATIKSIVVVLYFMQIRYDNPLNGVIIIFTLFCVAFFLGFVMIDLGNRKLIYPYKGMAIVEGGLGGSLGSRVTATATSIAMDARERADKQIEQLKADEVPMDKWPKVLSKYYAHKQDAAQGGHGAAGHAFLAERGDNTPDKARPRKGITLPELAPAGKADEGHGEKPASGTGLSTLGGNQAEQP